MRRVMYLGYYYSAVLSVTKSLSVPLPVTCDYLRIEYAIHPVSGTTPSVNIQLRENQFNNMTCNVKSTGVLSADTNGILELNNPSPTMSLFLTVAGTTPVLEVELVLVIGNDC